MGLSIEQINKIVAQYVAKAKEFEAKKKQYRQDPIEQKTIYPEYWEGYAFAARMYDAILPHARADVYPSHLLSVRAPNQTEAQAKYIKANYKPTTLNVFEDFKATVSRSFADQNWSLQVKPEKDERFTEDNFDEYINTQIVKYGSVESFVKQMLPSLKLMDANGLIAIRPASLNFITDEENQVIYNDEGKPMLSNELIEPIPVYFNCKDIVAQEIGRWYLVETEMDSLVKEGVKMVKEGKVLEFYDDFGIYRIEQYGKKSDYTFGEPILFFEHKLGYVPAKKLGGTPMLIDGELCYQSPFITAVGLLDQVILDESYLQMVKAGSAFPHMVALGEPCTFIDSEGRPCNDGRIWNDLAGKDTTCPACSGAGVRSRFSPTGVLLIKPKTSLSDGDSGLSGDYLKFVSPQMDTLDFLRKEITQYTSRSREVLHLPSADAAATIGEANTATGSLNKMRSLYAFLKPISDQLFGMFEFILETIGKERYGEYFGGFNLVYPTSFDVNTPSDYLSIISEGVKAGVPPSVIYASVFNYIKSINFTDSESTKIYELIVNADAMLTLSQADAIALIANGTYEKWQAVVHNSAPQLIMGLMRNFKPTAEAETFLELPMDEKLAQLKQAAIDTLANVGDPLQQAQNTLLKLA